MKKLIFLTILHVSFVCNGQSITLSPSNIYPFTVKTGGDGTGIYGDIGTESAYGIQYYYVSSTPASLGTEVGSIFGSASRFGLSSNTSLVLKTAYNDRMTILSNGNVGIGYNNPNHHFEVFKTGNVGSWGSYPNALKIAIAGNGTHLNANETYDAIGVAGYGNNAAGSGAIYRNIGVLGNSGPTALHNIGVCGYQKGDYSGVVYGVMGRSESSASTSYSSFGVAGYNYGLGSGQKVAIYGEVSSSVSNSYAGKFVGDVSIQGNMYYTGGLIFTSDEKLKNNVKPINSAVEKILALNPSSFDYKTDEYKELRFTPGNHFGFTAQEVQKVLPDLVKQVSTITDNADNPSQVVTNTYLSVNYIEIIPILTKAIQEQQVMLKELQAEILKLKK